MQPSAVLVEGPSDANALIGQMVVKGVVPPIAMLAYTDELPVRTLLYPLADYSPEYQAFQWANRHGALCEFIDLPSGNALAMHGIKSKETEAVLPETEAEQMAYVRAQNGLYERIAELAEEPDYEAYWERYFEHNGNPNAYRTAIVSLSSQMRELSEAYEFAHRPHDTAYNEIREAYMRRKIQDTIAAGHAADQIVVVTGAYHAAALLEERSVMTDREPALLPASPTRLTLMPYTYYKLSSRSGYGAGNQTPAYFQLFWECLQAGRRSELPTVYMSKISCRFARKGYLSFDRFRYRGGADGGCVSVDAERKPADVEGFA